MTNELDYRAIRKRVEADIPRLKYRKRLALFLVSLVMTVFFLIMAWGLFVTSGGVVSGAALATGQSDNPLVGAMMVLSVSGFLGVLFQFISLSFDSKRGEDRMRERLLAREMNREMMRLGADDVGEHEKRKGMMRLTDDGELESVEDEAKQSDEERQISAQR